MTDTRDRVPMTDTAGSLDEDLERLRRHLHGMGAPEHLEGELLAAFRAQQQIAGARRGKRGIQRLAAGLAAGIAVGALVTAVVAVQRPLRPAPQASVMSAPASPTSPAGSLAGSPPEAVASEHESEASQASRVSSLQSRPSTLSFQPLMHAPQISPRESYSVVRVRVPITLMSAAGDYELHGSIEADVLLGVDGLASGISFDAATAVLEATGAQQFYDQPIR